MKKLLTGFFLCAIVFLAVAAVVRKPVTSAAALQIMTGSGTTATDGTQTNTFGTAFSTAPLVFITQTGTAANNTNTVNSIGTVTASGIIYIAGKSGVTYSYLAIGAP